MYKFVFATCLAITAGSVILSASLWQQLRSERTRIAQLEQHDAAGAALQATSTPMRAIPEVEARQIAPTNASPPSTPGIEAPRSVVTRAPSWNTAPPVSPRESSEFMYPDIEEELNLGPSETDALYALLAQRADDAAIIRLLGPWRFQQLQAYKKTISARQYVRGLQASLPQQLTKDQYRLFVEASAASTERFTEDARNNSKSAAADPGFDLGGANMRAKRESLIWLYAEAKRFLSPAQFAAIDEGWQKADEAMQKQNEAWRKAATSR